MLHPNAWEKQMDRFVAISADNRLACIKVGETELEVQIASTHDSRVNGLAPFEELPGDGMLFVYQGDHNASFSCENMNFDISIWFFDSNGDMVDSGWNNTVAPVLDVSYRYVLETSPDAELQGKLEIIRLA